MKYAIVRSTIDKSLGPSPRVDFRIDKYHITSEVVKGVDATR